jgi:hypothetical protein
MHEVKSVKSDRLEREKDRHGVDGNDDHHDVFMLLLLQHCIVATKL